MMSVTTAKKKISNEKKKEKMKQYNEKSKKR